MKTPVGARVGALLSADATTVFLLGYGVYDGDHEPPFGPMGMPKAEWDAVLAEERTKPGFPEGFAWTNPRITLDDGRVVWGCQCWWGPEEVIRRKIEGMTVVQAVLS